jgi:serine/threonine protein phosphatase PrpC
MVSMQGQSGRTSLVEYAAATTTGACRVDNEDAFGVFERSHVFVVVDGCGGRSSGKSAANLAVKSFADHPAAMSGVAEMDPLALAVLAANADVFQGGQDNAQSRGQGATLCAVRVSPKMLSVVHVGDCRVGRFREGRLDWLTQDHSLEAELRKSGASAEDVASVAEDHSNVVVRAVGPAEDLSVDLAYHSTKAGDLYVLCSDGLTRQVARDHIAELLTGGALSLSERCTALLAASESAGGQDNATVLLIQLR